MRKSVLIIISMHAQKSIHPQTREVSHANHIQPSMSAALKKKCKKKEKSLFIYPGRIKCIVLIFLTCLYVVLLAVFLFIKHIHSHTHTQQLRNNSDFLFPSLIHTVNSYITYPLREVIFPHTISTRVLQLPRLK